MDKLATVNAFRVKQGLEPFAVLPGTVRVGKTARQDKRQQTANRATHAAQCQALKSARSGNSKKAR